MEINLMKSLMDEIWTIFFNTDLYLFIYPLKIFSKISNVLHMSDCYLVHTYNLNGNEINEITNGRNYNNLL